MDRVVNLCTDIHEAWSLPLQILAALVLLYTQVLQFLKTSMCNSPYIFFVGGSPASEHVVLIVQLKVRYLKMDRACQVNGHGMIFASLQRDFTVYLLWNKGISDTQLISRS